MAIDDPQGIRWDCRPCLPLRERLTAADGVGQGSVIPSHDPSRISRLRPVWRKLPSLRGKSPRVRGFADFYQRFFRRDTLAKVAQTLRRVRKEWAGDDFCLSGGSAGGIPDNRGPRLLVELLAHVLVAVGGIVAYAPVELKR